MTTSKSFGPFYTLSQVLVPVYPMFTRGLRLGLDTQNPNIERKGQSPEKVNQSLLLSTLIALWHNYEVEVDFFWIEGFLYSIYHAGEKYKKDLAL